MTSSSTVAEVQQLYDAALSVVNQHNEVVGSDNPGFVNTDQFMTCLKGTVGVNIRQIRYEDVLACLPEFQGPNGAIKPIPLAKAIVQAIRKGEPSEVVDPVNVGDSVSYVSPKKAERMSNKQLIDNFEPDEPDNAVGVVLQRKSKGQPFLVYSEGRQLDREASLTLFNEVKLGHVGRTVYKGKKVYKIGELPDNLVPENPLYRNTPLRPDGTCTQTNRSWEGVPQNVRQFVAFAAEYEGGIDVTTPPNGIQRAHDIIDIAVSSDAMKRFEERYQEIMVEFREAEKRGELPKLLIPLGKPIDAQEGVDSSPFPVGKK
jgi:hypothetical protein